MDPRVGRWITVWKKKMESLEICLYHRILRISWIEKVTNMEKAGLLNTTKKRKLTYFGHIMHRERYELLHLMMERKIAGKRSIGRRQNSWMKDLRRWFTRSFVDLFHQEVS